MRTELVGRDAELGALVGYLDDVCAGRPRIVLCQGEPGIGKTRLAQELADTAEGLGVASVWGTAVEAAGAPPFWLWRQVLRGMRAVSDIVTVAEEGGVAADLALVAPELFSAREPPSEEAAADRFRQFDAMGRLLRLAVVNRPLLVVLDDAHLADVPSRLLLEHVARTASDESLLLLANYRSTEEVPGRHLAELRRQPSARELRLRGIPAEAVRRWLEGVHGTDIEAADVSWVHDRSAGNPLFVNELSLVLADQRAGRRVHPVTTSLRDAIDARLSHRSAECVRLLHAASVVGPNFGLAVVAGMLGLPESDCLAPLDEASAAGLLELRSHPGAYRFSHGLVQEAIAASLGSRELVELHRRAAVTIESSEPPDGGARVFDIARHWAVAARAGERGAAARWLERAGESAMRALAYEDAARLFRRALEVGVDEHTDESRCRLLCAEASAMHSAGDFAGRLDACLEASAAARRAGRADLLAQAALVLTPLGHEDSDPVSRQLCHEALAWPEMAEADPALRARLLASYAEACMFTGWFKEHGLADFEEAREACAQAMELAERSGDTAAMEAALRARRLECSAPDGLEERAVLADRLLAIGRATDSIRTQFEARMWQVDVAFERGDLTRVGREVDELAWCADRLRTPMAQYELHRCRAVLAQAQSRFGEALRQMEKAYAILGPSGHDHPAAPVVRAGLLQMVGHHIGHEAGESELANDALHSLAPVDQQYFKEGVILGISRAHLLASVGRLPEAADLYRALGPIDAWWPSPHALLPSYAFGIGVAIVLDDAEGLDTLCRLLAPYRGHHVVSSVGPVAYTGPVELWLGLGARHLGRLDDAVADLADAAAACAASGATAFRAEAQYELAGTLVLRARPGDEARARELLAECGRNASALGMGPIRARADDLAERLDTAGPLTRREWEVAELVARGMTNREIAARLYVSERTAQNHVQHILAKLGSKRRSQIAAWMTRRKMSTPAE